MPSHYGGLARATASAFKGKRKKRFKDKVGTVMGEFKRGNLHSGSKTGPKVTNRKQAIAIALSEARRRA